MFVTRHKYNNTVRGYQNQVKRLNETVERLQNEVFELRGEDAIANELDASLEKTALEFEETPKHPVRVEIPAADNDADTTAKKTLEMPPRSEYDDRLKTALRLFRENHPRSEVERILNVSRNTARKYLRIARDKKRISAKRYDELNK